MIFFNIEERKSLKKSELMAEDIYPMVKKMCCYSSAQKVPHVQIVAIIQEFQFSLFFLCLEIFVRI